ncbi:hypothetical protein ASPZODRAFT_17540 [Penicilliopsis zonata CBS 506.65]|uniref:Ketoreductase (KR) domain-containing protein n=1 Tax=Penicilliopsis zonata CBS 506.65 TaxID=1073090 RepID=A0A1L9SE07_9EURO|nr:hypothetical protein ASPZODRAFT_17540 [Penicilliopsis zonata CBS 506.65]OJJ45324.1 hypothetical protein ASPZODRAFT_17540 [Penicilliopsis zonata CBS 506.65]
MAAWTMRAFPSRVIGSIQFGPGEIERAPEPWTLNGDLLGTLYFARIAAVFLRQDASREADRSLVLVSSIAGFTGSPGLPLYSASKHGVLGLMCALRTSLPDTHKISVSAVCPWTSAKGMEDEIAGLAAWGRRATRKTIYVEGGRPGLGCRGGVRSDPGAAECQLDGGSAAAAVSSRVGGIGLFKPMDEDGS